MDPRACARLTKMTGAYQSAESLIMTAKTPCIVLDATRRRRRWHKAVTPTQGRADTARHQQGHGRFRLAGGRRYLCGNTTSHVDTPDTYTPGNRGVVFLVPLDIEGLRFSYFR